MALPTWRLTLPVFFVCIMGYLMHEHCQEESTIDVLIVYWPVIDLKARAPPFALSSASPAQRGTASSSPDRVGSAESDGTIVTYVDCEE